VETAAAAAAAQAAGIENTIDGDWIIVAPNNTAFADPGVLNQTGLTAQQLLQPANKQALTQVTCETAGAGLSWQTVFNTTTNSRRVLMLYSYSM
jgi:hypothetical protein